MIIVPAFRIQREWAQFLADLASQLLTNGIDYFN